MGLREETLREIEIRLHAGETLLFLQTDDELRWQAAINELSSQLQRPVWTWSLSTGLKLPDGRLQPETRSPEQFLQALSQAEPGGVYLAKDLQYFLSQAEVIRYLQDQAQLQPPCPLLILGNEFELPAALAKSVSILRLPLPDFSELRECLDTVAIEAAPELTLAPEFAERMVKGVIGLTLQQTRRAFQRVLQGRTDLGEEVMTQLISEKKQLLQGSDLLEFHELDETADDIGGLEALKEWVNRRAKAFSPEARKRNVGQPKGVLLLGVQGCGKSLSARVIARQLSFPLIRLDFSSLLEGGRGSSEHNLREVLRMMDNIAPAVLWIEDLETGVAGLEGEGEQRDAALSRMFGLFLTWLQEHNSPIFVVATANAIESLPPELLRRGRFDELFFIDLPNFHERQHIFRIHLAKRNCDPAQYQLEELSDKTEGYSGAEIEQVVNSAVIDAFTHDRLPSQKDLLDSADLIVPLSVTMEEKVFTLREWARSRCRPATPDSRIMRMLEEEHRKGELNLDDQEFLDPWREALNSGDLPGAMLEFVRANDHVTFPKMLQAFETTSPTSGHFAVVLESDPCVVIWPEMTQPIAESLARYINNKRFFLNPVDVSQYQKLGTVLSLPVLRALRDKPLPRDVWFPCLLRIMPPREGSGRLRDVTVRELKSSS